MNSHNRKVDAGSKEQDFIGDDITILRTSSCEHNRKDVNDDVARSMIGGGGRPAVSERTLSFLPGEESSESVGSVTCSTSDVTQTRHRLPDPRRRSAAGLEPTEPITLLLALIKPEPTTS